MSSRSRSLLVVASTTGSGPLPTPLTTSWFRRRQRQQPGGLWTSEIRAFSYSLLPPSSARRLKERGRQCQVIASTTNNSRFSYIKVKDTGFRRWAWCRQLLVVDYIVAHHDRAQEVPSAPHDSPSGRSYVAEAGAMAGPTVARRAGAKGRGGPHTRSCARGCDRCTVGSAVLPGAVVPRVCEQRLGAGRSSRRHRNKPFVQVVSPV
jgi:hypothetical protein